MDDGVTMAVLQSASNLSRKLAGSPFPQPAVGDDVIEHLTTVNELEDHVVMMCVDDHLPHTADVGMVQEHRNGRLSHSADLFR